MTRKKSKMLVSQPKACVDEDVVPAFVIVQGPCEWKGFLAVFKFLVLRYKSYSLALHCEEVAKVFKGGQVARRVQAVLVELGNDGADFPAPVNFELDVGAEDQKLQELQNTEHQLEVHEQVEKPLKRI